MTNMVIHQGLLILHFLDIFFHQTLPTTYEGEVKSNGIQ